MTNSMTAKRFIDTNVAIYACDDRMTLTCPEKEIAIGQVEAR